MNTDTLLAEEKPTHYRDFAVLVTPGLDPNGPDVVATITCDSVDADKEVVLPQGADLSRYVKAPRVMLCHAYGRPGEYYPLPIGKALWTKRQGRAIVQGIRFARSSAMGREVQGLFEEGMLNTFSIGFVSLEASRPSTQEKAMHPEWREVNLIHRRWKLLEVSVVPIPCNEDAVGVYLRKGKALPAFVWIPDSLRKAHPMEINAQEQTGQSLDTTTAPADADIKAIGESSGTGGGYVAQDLPRSSETKDESGSDPRDCETEVPREQDARYTPEAGHFVKWDDHVGMHKGCGRVVSVHKSGRVPDTDNEAHANDVEPYARIKYHKAVDGDPHTLCETDRHVAVKCSMCERMSTVGRTVDAKVKSSSEEPHAAFRFIDAPALKAVVPYAPGPIIQRTWDAGAARARLKAWADGDMAKYRKGFAWCDAAKSDNEGSYKFPHHDVRDGELVVVKEGVIAALAALDGARGGTNIPGKEAVRAHLEKHRRAFEGPASKIIPPFRTRAQVLAGMERQIRAKLDPKKIAEEARRQVVEQAFGVV